MDCIRLQGENKQQKGADSTEQVYEKNTKIGSHGSGVGFLRGAFVEVADSCRVYCPFAAPPQQNQSDLAFTGAAVGGQVIDTINEDDHIDRQCHWLKPIFWGRATAVVGILTY